MRAWLAPSAIGVVLAALTWRCEIVQVSHDSMAPTYCDGDWLIAFRPTGYEELRGKVVVIQHANQPSREPWLKRVLAEGGDRISVVNGIALVNGRSPDEAYVDCRARLSEHDLWKAQYGLNVTGSALVPADELYVLGDNRAVSIDSRLLGTMSRAAVTGIVAFTLRLRAPCHC